MSTGLIALLLSLGAGTWVYTVFMKKTGSQVMPSALAAGIVAILIFITALLIMSFIPD